MMLIKQMIEHKSNDHSVCHAKCESFLRTLLLEGCLQCFLTSQRKRLARSVKTTRMMQAYVTMRLKSIFLICLKMMCMNLKRKRMQGITVKSKFRQRMIDSCLLTFSGFRQHSSMRSSRISRIQLSWPLVDRRARLRRQSMTELKARALMIVRQSWVSTRSYIVKRKMAQQISLLKRSLASNIIPFLYNFLSNFLKTAAFNLLILMPNRQRKRLEAVELRMMTNRMKSMQMMKKWMIEQRKLRSTSNHIQPGFVLEFMMIFGSFSKQVLPVVVNIISKMMVERPTLQSLTVLCPLKKWYRKETSKYQKSCTIRVQPAMMMQAKKEVRLILSTPKIGRSMLRLEAMRSQAQRTMVSQVVQKAQKAQSQQQYSILKKILMKPSIPSFKFFFIFTASSSEFGTNAFSFSTSLGSSAIIDFRTQGLFLI